MNRDQIYDAITAERERQHAKWGKQDFPLLKQRRHREQFYNEMYYDVLEREAKSDCEQAQLFGIVSWEIILREELTEVLGAKTPEERRAELIQLAAVCVQIVEGMDDKAGGETMPEITLRDLFAGLAMQAWLSSAAACVNGCTNHCPWNHNNNAMEDLAYEKADRMLAARGTSSLDNVAAHMYVVLDQTETLLLKTMSCDSSPVCKINKVRHEYEKVIKEGK